MDTLTKLLLIAALSLCCVVGNGQDLKKDLEQVFAAYRQRETLHLDIGLKIYTAGAAQPGYQSTGKIRKNGDHFYYQTGDTRMLVSPTLLLMINEQEKDILYRSIGRDEYEQFLKNSLSSNMDSVIASYDSVSFRRLDSGARSYTIHTSKGMIAKTELTLDAEGFRHIVYYYNSSVAGAGYRADITFRQVPGAAHDAAFTAEHYVTRSGKEYRLTPAFRSYRLTPADDTSGL